MHVSNTILTLVPFKSVTKALPAPGYMMLNVIKNSALEEPGMAYQCTAVESIWYNPDAVLAKNPKNFWETTSCVGRLKINLMHVQTFLQRTL